MTNYAPKSFLRNAALRQSRALDRARTMLRRQRKEVKDTMDSRAGSVSEEGMAFLNGILRAVGGALKPLGGR